MFYEITNLLNLKINNVNQKCSFILFEMHALYYNVIEILYKIAY